MEEKNLKLLFFFTTYFTKKMVCDFVLVSEYDYMVFFFLIFVKKNIIITGKG